MPEKIISILDPLMNIDDHILTAPGDETFDEWNLKWALMTWVDKVRILVQEQHDEIEKLKDIIINIDLEEPEPEQKSEIFEEPEPEQKQKKKIKRNKRRK